MVVEFFEVVVGGCRSFHVLVTTVWENICFKIYRKIVLQMTEIKFPYLECVFVSSF